MTWYGLDPGLTIMVPGPWSSGTLGAQFPSVVSWSISGTLVTWSPVTVTQVSVQNIFQYLVNFLGTLVLWLQVTHGVKI